MAFYLKHAPRNSTLAHFAKAILAIVPSTSETERGHKGNRDTRTPSRNRLSNERTDNLVRGHAIAIRELRAAAGHGREAQRSVPQVMKSLGEPFVIDADLGPLSTAASAAVAAATVAAVAPSGPAAAAGAANEAPLPGAAAPATAGPAAVAHDDELDLDDGDDDNPLADGPAVSLGHGKAAPLPDTRDALPSVLQAMRSVTAGEEELNDDAVEDEDNAMLADLLGASLDTVAATRRSARKHRVPSKWADFV